MRHLRADNALYSVQYRVDDLAIFTFGQFNLLDRHRDPHHLLDF